MGEKKVRLESLTGKNSIEEEITISTDKGIPISKVNLNLTLGRFS